MENQQPEKKSEPPQKIRVSGQEISLEEFQEMKKDPRVRLKENQDGSFTKLNREFG